MRSLAEGEKHNVNHQRLKVGSNFKLLLSGSNLVEVILGMYEEFEMNSLIR